MLSVHAPPVPVPAAPAPFNMAAHVLTHAARLADKSAMQILRPTGAERWSYARLEAAVRGAGTGLLRAGAEPGDRVLLRLGNTPEFPVAYLGALAAGLVPIPTSAQLTTPEITRMAALTGPRLVIAGEGIALPEGIRAIPETELRSWEALPPCAYDMGDPERLGYIVFTSGTSAAPRAVMHAHRAILARRMMYDGWYGLRETDRLLHAGAFNWTYTLGTGLMDPWSVGATALIPAAGINPEALPLLMRRFDATLFAAAPGIYRKILKHHTKISLPRLRHGLSAGEALSGITRQLWTEATGTPIHEALGMSECSTFVSSSPRNPAPEGTAGWPQEGRHVAVVADGRPVPRGTPGTLAVHRADPGLFLGYMGAPGETASRFAGDWFLTGDTVEMTAEGAIRYLGRDDDMMNAGGFRVSPLEVEAAMAACPEAGDVAAVEIRVSAEASVIALAHTGQATPEALAAHAATALARYKQPRIWRRLPDLPRNPNGKIDRRAIRAAWPPETK